MSADPIVYCLEHLTDYRQFERLCSDIMAGSGYRNIDPVGGTGDRGRDALHKGTEPDGLTIFAYTVRSDWRKKLQEDCERIKTERHNPNRVVFVCTSTLTGNQKDEATSSVFDQFGWLLELFDLERIRVLLAGELRHLVAQHPSIFCPPWFPTRGGLSIAESADTLVIDHMGSDHALATWLARRLSLAGFRTWCYGTAPLAGEDADSSVRLLIQNRALQYLPILSPCALDDADMMGRCGAASAFDGLVLPCWSAAIDDSALNAKLRRVEPARFDLKWSIGLRNVLDSLRSRGITPSLENDRSRAIALRAYVPEQVTKPTPERVFANVFPASVPKSIVVCNLHREMDSQALEQLRRSWAFVVASPMTLLAFEEPPDSVPLETTSRLPEYAWEHYETREGKRSVDVVKELIRRSLAVACFRAGLEWCEDRRVLYFPHIKGPQRNISFQHVDGRNTWVSVTGEKQHSWGVNATRFRYQLGPMFRVGRDETGNWWVTTRIYVRVTDCAGVPFQLKEITRKRKTVTKNWWNKEWLARILGIMQALKVDGDSIEVGNGKRRVSVSTTPLGWECPVSIDVEAIDRVGDFQEEMAAMRYVDEEDEEEEPVGIPEDADPNE